MSDVIKKYAVPYLIRNRDTRPWPRRLMRLSTMVAVLGCGVAVVVASIDLHSRITLLFLVPILIGMVGSVGLAIFMLIRRPVTHVVLGKTLQTRPDKLSYQISDVELIDFVRDLKEDYDDTIVALSLQTVRICLRSSSRLRTLNLLLIASDMKLLNEWATLNRVRGARSKRGLTAQPRLLWAPRTRHDVRFCGG